MRNKLLIFGLATLTFAACTYDFPETAEPTTGEADFTKMVSVGNSLTAGYMDGALYATSQANSFPSIIAQQAALVGGGAFSQPTVTSANGCYNPTGGCTQGRLILKNPSSPGPAPTTGDGGAVFAAYTGSKTALNNWGVPGVTLGSALSPALSASPYYARIASNPGTSTLVGDAAASLANGGTFFTFWLGNNDVLGYATAGGAGSPITAQGDFATRFNAALSAMLGASANAKGAVANIPNVTSIPFFSTVAYNAVVFLSSNPTHVATVAQLNSMAAYGGFNAALQGLVGAGVISQAEADKRKVVFKHGSNSASGANAVVIQDETLADLGAALGTINPALAGFAKVRQATATDLITLTAGAVLPLGQGVSSPLADQYVLLPAEQTEIQTAIDGFNATISAAVTANSARLVLVDANQALRDIKAGLVAINGSSFTASILPPFGAFSLDGVHPNPRGSAYMANIFIDAINKKWGGKIPLCNPNDFIGNALPIP